MERQISQDGFQKAIKEFTSIVKFLGDIIIPAAALSMNNFSKVIDCQCECHEHEHRDIPVVVVCCDCRKNEV